MLDFLIGIDVKPALAARVLRPAVPGKGQHLQTAIGEFDEVLLQRIDPEGIFHLEHAELAIEAIGFDKKLSVLAKEARMDAVIIETGIVEIAEHGLVGGVLHCGLVLRGIPQICFRLVAARAGLAADEGCGRTVLRCDHALVVNVNPNTGNYDDNGRDRRRNADGAA